MKKRRFPYERIPAFVVYGIVAFYAVRCFTHGANWLFVGALWYLFGMLIDPKSDLYERRKDGEGESR